MLDRLKSLPLTILLTLLIWMYAESQVYSAHIETTTISQVPILITGPPDALLRYQVVLENNAVSVEISGPQDQIAAIRGRPPGDSGIYAYFDVTPQDHADGKDHSRSVRFVTPTGITVTNSPQATFRLVEAKK